MEKGRGVCDGFIKGEHSEIVRYLIFGVLNVIVTWGAYALFVHLGIEPSLSNILSIVIGILFGFVCNKFWVFDSRSTETKTVGREFATFVGGRIVTAVIAAVLFPVLYHIGLNQVFLGTDGFLAKIITTIVETALNYVISKYLVFVKKER